MNEFALQKQSEQYNFFIQKKFLLLFSNKLLHTNWQTARTSISFIIQKREFCLQNKKIIEIVSLLKHGIVGVSYRNHGAIIRIGIT